MPSLISEISISLENTAQTNGKDMKKCTGADFGWHEMIRKR